MIKEIKSYLIKVSFVNTFEKSTSIYKAFCDSKSLISYYAKYYYKCF